MSIYDDDWGDVADVDTPRTISRAEQEQTGLTRRNARNTYVSPTPHRADLPAHTGHSVMLDIQPSAQQIVEVRTSAVDRAKGYTITLVPLSVVLAVLAVLVSLAFDNEFLSFASLLIFWLTFAVCWLAGWVVTLLLSAEGVAFFEAHRKWNIVENEQRERWSHWRWQAGRNE